MTVGRGSMAGQGARTRDAAARVEQELNDAVARIKARAAERGERVVDTTVTTRVDESIKREPPENIRELRGRYNGAPAGKKGAQARRDAVADYLAAAGSSTAHRVATDLKTELPLVKKILGDLASERPPRAVRNGTAGANVGNGRPPTLFAPPPEVDREESEVEVDSGADAADAPADPSLSLTEDEAGAAASPQALTGPAGGRGVVNVREDDGAFEPADDGSVWMCTECGAEILPQEAWEADDDARRHADPAVCAKARELRASAPGASLDEEEREVRSAARSGFRVPGGGAVYRDGEHVADIVAPEPEPEPEPEPPPEPEPEETPAPEPEPAEDPERHADPAHPRHAAPETPPAIFEVADGDDGEPVPPPVGVELDVERDHVRVAVPFEALVGLAAPPRRLTQPRDVWVDRYLTLLFDRAERDGASDEMLDRIEEWLRALPAEPPRTLARD